MTETVVHPINIVFDKKCAQFILDAFTGIDPNCYGCDKKVTRHTLGAIAKIDGKTTICHNNLICMLEYLQKQEAKSK